MDEPDPRDMLPPGDEPKPEPEPEPIPDPIPEPEPGPITTSKPKPNLKIILGVVGALIVLVLLGIFVIQPLLTKDKKPATKGSATKIVKKTPSAGSGSKPKAPVTPIEEEPAIPNCIADEPSVEVDKGEVDDIVGEWADAWTKQDFKKYKSFYSRKFTGIKRTTRHRTVHYGYKTWMQNRKGMLNYARWTKLEVEDLEIQCASKDEIKIKFTQYYRSPTYNDVGPKTITFKRRDGGLKITYEEMLESNHL